MIHRFRVHPKCVASSPAQTGPWSRRSLLHAPADARTVPTNSVRTAFGWDGPHHDGEDPRDRRSRVEITTKSPGSWQISRGYGSNAPSRAPRHTTVLLTPEIGGCRESG